MTTLTSDSIADSESTAATAPQTPGPLQRAWGRCFAAIYEPLMQATENGGNAARRAAVLARARGTVVELGAGTGLNLPHYPSDVELVLTEPEPPMARRLLERLQESGRQARVLQAPAERIPLPDGSVDTVVCTLVLCTVHDLDATLTEIRRLLRPDGRLLFIEHVAAEPGTRLRRWQDRLERPWRRFAHGCHTNRDTEDALRNAGFALEELHHGQMEAELLLRPLTWGATNLAAPGRRLSAPTKPDRADDDRVPRGRPRAVATALVQPAQASPAQSTGRYTRRWLDVPARRRCSLRRIEQSTRDPGSRDSVVTYRGRWRVTSSLIFGEGLRLTAGARRR